MSGHPRATFFLSHYIAYVLSMENCHIPIILSKQAHFVSPHAR